jgi:SpoVK/Ycf46/Vps4 family AAA+-type ATPase
VFERARENRPSIVFIDEIDAIAGTRGEFQVHDSHVNQLLAEIDGVTGQRGVFVIGATNRPDQLDPALLRGGRLSRTIYLGLLDEAGRLAIPAASYREDAHRGRPVRRAGDRDRGVLARRSQRANSGGRARGDGARAGPECRSRGHPTTTSRRH